MGKKKREPRKRYGGFYGKGDTLETAAKSGPFLEGEMAGMDRVMVTKRRRDTPASVRKERDALFTEAEKGRRRVLELEAELLKEQGEVRDLSNSIAGFREGLSDVSHTVGAWARAGFDDIDNVAVAARRLLVRVHGWLDGKAGGRVERVLTQVRELRQANAQRQRVIDLKGVADEAAGARSPWPPACSLSGLMAAFEDFEARRSAVAGPVVYRRGA